MVVRYSDHHLVNGPPFEYQSAIWLPDTVVLGIGIANHLNNKQVKVDYSDVSAVVVAGSLGRLQPDEDRVFDVRIPS